MIQMKSKERLYLGGQYKLNVYVEPMGDVTLDNYDWSVELFVTPGKKQIVKKVEAIRVDANNYVVRHDTTLVGAGDLQVRVVADVPDGDFPNNVRREVLVMDTVYEIVK